jgi:hypothetical protein
MTAAPGLTRFSVQLLLRPPYSGAARRTEEQLESRIAEVNGRIATRENAHFEFIRHGRHVRWTLRYPHESEGLNHPFFDRLKQLGISSNPTFCKPAMPVYECL